MKRIKVELPENLPFSTDISIRITDINYGNHVGNQVFMELIHEARVRFLQQFGYKELDVEGTSLIMADAAIGFNTELVYGDNVKIQVGAGEFSRVGFDLYYLLTVIRDNKELVAGKAKTGMICFDYTSKKVVAIPNVAIANIIAGVVASPV